MKRFAIFGMLICQLSFAQIAKTNLANRNDITQFSVPTYSFSPIQFQPTNTQKFGFIAQKQFAGLDLNQAQVQYIQQTGKHRFRILANYNGSPDYNNTIIHFDYALKFNPKLTVGFGASGGLLVHFIETERTAETRIFANYQLSKSNSLSYCLNGIPKHLSQSLAYNHSWNESLLGSISMDANSGSYVLSANASYQIIPELWASVGLNSSEFLYHAALAYKKGQWAFSIKTNYHPSLFSFQPSFGLIYVVSETSNRVASHVFSPKFKAQGTNR
jgi:hypothetical protein